ITPQEAIEGALIILAERIEQDYKARMIIKEMFWRKGLLVSTSTKTAQNQKTQFEAFYNYSESIRKISSIRFLQILRGMRLGFLKVSLEINEDEAIEELIKIYVKDKGSVFEPLIRISVQDAFRKQLKTVCENRVFIELKENIEQQFISELRDDLIDTLMFPPANLETVISIIPGIEEEWAVCVVDRDGNLLESSLIFPMAPRNEVKEAQDIIKFYIERYQSKHIVIGNGAGVDEAFQFVGELASQYTNPRVRFVTFEQRFAQSFAHSKMAEIDLPNHSEKIREAYYLARYFNSPLKELIKLNLLSLPEGILHKEINERKFTAVAHQIIEHCINSIGVDINKASINELRHIAGLKHDTAQNIIEYRTAKGGFKNRKELLEVPGIDETIFQQCAGFLFIKNGDNPLDQTRIHPQWYEYIETAVQDLNIEIPSLFRSFKSARTLIRHLETKNILGKHAIRTILKELKTPGRDPRGYFVFPRYTEGIYRVSDLKVGMQTEGIIKKILNNLIVVDIGIPIDAVIHLKNNPSLTKTLKRNLLDKKIGEFLKVNIESIDFDNQKVILIPYFPPKKDKKEEGKKERKEKSFTSKKENTAVGTGFRDLPVSEKPKFDRKVPKFQKPNIEKDIKKSSSILENQLLNTQLADQLAILKDKLQP
ncbi:MAG: helix-hairpin-helix domain-containing protein, partial [Candidatus Hydrogenedens sp.]